MLSYQHLYHAGCPADCHKHALLCLLLQRLQEKEVAYCYRDLHSGRGLYDLTCDEALKTGEFKDGIMPLWENKEWPQAIQPYHDLLMALNPDNVIHSYLGSPFLAASLQRSQDRAELHELHPQEFARLEQNMARFTHAECLFDDGWQHLTNDAAPKENRGLVLIDPSFELKEDYALMPMRLEQAVRKWRNGIYAIWYPLLPNDAHQIMIEGLLASPLRKILRSEIIFQAADDRKGMYGSGMLILNPPWQIEEQINDVLDWMVAAIGQSHECGWLIPE